ncbi:type VI secretion system tip protein TssI/VgrG [Pseudomonas salmasensis]|uniref:Type VI secretion system tip protein TssI/VgrG n=1 Tax=Pseudomonas salmasensis TaxID=2745514 RepID=A0ABU5FH71_9PSED|nr:type VI secretion system tip protein TssI/VgrG [Pseudomonas salmasensis]MDY4301112.1 type VI secretion system tip protein TssI/VgrG [Pseudomonas salmasensis]
MPRQSDLRYTFEPLRGDPFEVVSFTLEESLSQPFKLELDLVSHHPAIDFYRMLDLAAVFTIWRDDTPVRYVHGLVSLFQQGDTGFRRTRYTAVVEPTLARFNLRSNWRIFQSQTVPDIITSMLAEHKLTDIRSEICFEHQPREYCVQAGETDLDFIARLAAEEGLLYTFEHRADGHTLVLTDRVGGLGTIGTHTDCPVIYQPMGGGDSKEPALNRFHYTEQVRTARQVQRDYTFTHPRYDQQHTATGDQDLKNQHKDYERYDYPGRYKRDIAGKPFTKTRLTALRNDAKLAHVEGDDERLQPGLAFDLNDHPREDFNDRWRTIAIKHEGKQHTSLQEESFGSGLGTSYSLKASAIRWTSDWKAPLRDKPCIDGPQIATVVGPPGEEIYCDEWGRVKVQFPWDRADKNNDHSSCWIRVTQGWAGATWGSIAIPRVGQELVISHLDGDPDQPIATGAAYRQTNLPPYELPKHKTRMTIKSCTHKGEGFNELRFEDELGQEEVFIHAQKDQNTIVKNNQTQSIGADRSSQVGQDETITVGRTRMRVVKANDTLKVGGSKNDHIAGEYYIGVGKQLRLECGKTVIELNENGDLNITCENFNITGMKAGKVNTLSGKLDLNMSGKASGTTANGVSGADIQSDVEGYFNHE